MIALSSAPSAFLPHSYALKSVECRWRLCAAGTHGHMEKRTSGRGAGDTPRPPPSTDTLKAPLSPILVRDSLVCVILFPAWLRIVHLAKSSAFLPPSGSFSIVPRIFYSVTRVPLFSQVRPRRN
ncbi:hypothetical protein CDAR_567521 [Caerostris darwini]|uniref:Uncharacterized protein n=1 Tax=Caerostris darwini TaxID=1538125 RepID=A0AAV4QU99_9ARAC|nr:hypothetical protein CDAR_567521 [Caerostris darwini]